ncbi:MAG: hypothetical protein LQ342_001471 [Letrouitia transgressa]|nr:MAG: hypothetical protein LQ342_001471 [Letrouitia transgressa]
MGYNAGANKSKKRASKATEDYESDGGFVANDSGDDGPKSKKAKTSSSSASKAKASGAASNAKDEQFWEVCKITLYKSTSFGRERWSLTDTAKQLTGKRRVTVSEFNNKTMINIREYYEDKSSGKMLPGKKGISLPVPQFAALISALPELEAALQAKGEEIPRPDYGSLEGEGTGKHVETSSGGKEGGEEASEGKGKQNFEATSDEED